MKKTRAMWLKLMPWLVLLIMLGMTAGALRARSAAVDNSRATTLQAAEEHFDDVVADFAFRSQATAASYDRVLLSSVALIESPVDPNEVADRLQVLAPDGLPGLRGFFVIPAGGEITWTTEDPPALRIQTTATNEQPPAWFSTISDSPDLIAIGYQTQAGDLVGAIATTSDLLGISDDSHDGHDGHGVSATLEPLDTNLRAPVTIDGSRAAATNAMDDEEMHGAGHTAIDPETATFSASNDVTMFGYPWRIDAIASDEFLVIPASNEVAILGVAGILLSFSVFGLVSFLVRRVFTESRIRAAEARFAASFASSPIGFAILDSHGLILETNEALETLLDRPSPQLVGTPMVNLVAEADRTQWCKRVLNTDETLTRARVEVHYTCSQGGPIWVEETVTAVNAERGERNILIQLSDISEQRSAREELQRRALHDQLTGLANRTLLEDRLEQALRRSERTGLQAAVMFIDVDQFKAINDTLGHRAGDTLLRQLADRLRDVSRDHDTVARFGGDEFVILCEDLQSQSDVWHIAERIQRKVADDFFVEERVVNVTLSIGITLCNNDDSAEALLRDADLAMYQAKELGRDRAILFEREMREDLVQQLKLEDELVQAIRLNQLELYYQPILTVGDVDIAGFEALVRWNHPERGLLPPDQFLPEAAQLGFLRTIDVWALNEAARQLALWTAELEFAANWTISVNASPGNFGDTTFPTIVEDAVVLAGIDPSRLTIEITEEAILANTETAVGIISRLRALGVHTALDDFGTGYSSLSQLAALDIDVLKIDKSFLKNLQQSPSKEIVRAIVDMAKALGIPTVAEGVESYEDLVFLRSLGVSNAQGYLFSKPVPEGSVDGLATDLADTYTRVRQ